jgi:Tol biopolymer transport system component
MNSATNHGSRAMAKAPTTTADGLVYVVDESGIKSMKLVRPDGTAEPIGKPLGAELPSAVADGKGGWLFAARGKEGDALAIFRNSTLEREGATEVAPAAFKKVESMASNKDGKTLFVLGKLADEPISLYKIPKGIRAPILVTASDEFAINPVGDTALLVRKGKLDLYDLAKAKATPVAGIDSPVRHPVFSANGKKIAYVRLVDKSWSLFVSDRDGKNPTRLTKADIAEVSYPMFSKDGKKVVYTASEKGKSMVYQVAIDGKALPVAIKPTVDGNFAIASAVGRAAR